MPLKGSSIDLSVIERIWVKDRSIETYKQEIKRRSNNLKLKHWRIGRKSQKVLNMNNGENQNENKKTNAEKTLI